jgi:heme exporter protein D
MTLLALSWPWATVVSVAIAVLGLIIAAVWQTFAIAVKDDRETARELRLRQTSNTKT